MKRSTTLTPAIMAKMIMGILGGMMIPNVPPVERTPEASFLEYPASTRAGYIKDPIAIRVTGDEPEIAANTAQDRTAESPSPPGIPAVKDFAKLINLWEMLPFVMICPARMKSGIANKISLSAA